MNLPQAANRFINRYLVLKGHSDDTRRSYEGDLRQFSLFLAVQYGKVAEVADITDEDIEDFLFDQRSKLQAKVVKRRGSTLRSFFRWARKEGLVDSNVGLDVPLPKTTRSLPYCPSREVVHDFIDSCTNPLVWAMAST